MRPGSIFESVGIAIGLAGVYFYLTSSGSCPAHGVNPGGFPFTGCPAIDFSRVILAVALIIGIALFTYGFLDNRRHTTHKTNVVNAKGMSSRSN